MDVFVPKDVAEGLQRVVSFCWNDRRSLRRWRTYLLFNLFAQAESPKARMTELATTSNVRRAKYNWGTHIQVCFTTTDHAVFLHRHPPIGS